MLLISNDKVYTELTGSYLSSRGFSCELAESIQIADEKVNLYEYDCLILDLHISIKESFLLLSKLNSHDRSDGVLIVSDKASLEDKLHTFDLGADDFLNKDSDLQELKARINAIVRRKKYNTRSKIYFANLVADLQLKKVFVWDRNVTLTKKEYEILLHLLANKNRVLSKSSLAEYLWGAYVDEADSFDFLFAHIKNLRKKLKEAKAEIEIRNIYKMGYQIIEL